MSAFSAWHVVVVALVTVLPVLVLGAIVLIVLRVRRSSQASSEERIAQRAAEILRSEDRRSE